MSYLYQDLGQGYSAGLMVGSKPITGLRLAQQSVGARTLLAKKKKKKKKKRKRRAPILDVAPAKSEAPRAQREPMKVRKERRKPPVKEVLPDYKPPVKKQPPPVPRTPPPKPPGTEDLPAFAETQKAEKAPAPTPKSPVVGGGFYGGGGGGGGAAYTPPARTLPSVDLTPSVPFEPIIGGEEKPFPWLWVGLGAAGLAVWMVLR